MDIYCKRCGEPWDMDSLHEEISYRLSERTFNPSVAYESHYDSVKAEFFRHGCGTFTYAHGSGYQCERTDSARGHIAGALYEVFGDDLDGVASDLFDAESLGMFR